MNSTPHKESLVFILTSIINEEDINLDQPIRKTKLNINFV